MIGGNYAQEHFRCGYHCRYTPAYVCPQGRVGIFKSELYRRIEDGRLRARMVGSFMRVHRDDLAAMIDALPNVGD